MLICALKRVYLCVCMYVCLVLYGMCIYLFNNSFCTIVSSLYSLPYCVYAIWFSCSCVFICVCMCYSIIRSNIDPTLSIRLSTSDNTSEYVLSCLTSVYPLRLPNIRATSVCPCTSMRWLYSCSMCVL